ncbi:hypothetical protein [Diaphorobacter ruginosibacter]|uniref:hypothetical protein n=1 Tax=Diaphorobacter ruginosibacter TaxID=1715720 RepID=UPI003342C2EE
MSKSSISRRGGIWAAAVLCTLAASQAQAMCYELYSSSRQLLFRSMRTPVDLSKPLHQTVPRLAPGATLVFSPNSQGCEIEFNRLEPQAVIEIEGDGFRSVVPRASRRAGKS